MRKFEILSPTSLHLFESDREQFYLKYLSDARPPKEPQSGAMVVGSAFDAFVKCSLHQHLFGNDGGGKYDLKTLFEEQVNNKELRVWAWEAGKYAFDCYRTWGCYDELLRELEKSDEDPRFEFKLTGLVGEVPVVGYPDMWCKVKVQKVLDWKVNGFCSNNPQSPKKFYGSCRDCWGEDRCRPTRGGGQSRPHPKYEEIDHFGHKIGAHFLHETDRKWADQIAIYSWLLGVEVGDENMVAAIDQLACKPSPDLKKNRWPLIRVAQHRCRISKCWQLALFERLHSCWNTVQSGHIFDDLSREDSDSRCEVLDMPQTSGGDDDFWASVNERQFRG